MSVLDRISYFQGRRDEVPNQELARELAAAKDKKGIAEIAANLWHTERAIQSDCLKVLYEIGYLEPDLIADYADDFLKLLRSRHNRLVWGGMIALSTIAALRAAKLFEHRDIIQQTMDKGSVITKDAGVAVLAAIAAQDGRYNEQIFPYLLEHLATCRPKDVPQHSEKMVTAVTPHNQAAFIHILESRIDDLSSTQLKRVQKVIREVEKQH